MFSVKSLLYEAGLKQYDENMVVNLDMTQVKVGESKAKVVVSQKLAKGSGKRAINRRKKLAQNEFYVKLFSLQNAAGDVGPLVALITDPDLPVPLIKLEIKRFGLGPDSVGHIWIAQSKTGDLSREIFEDVYINVVAPWFKTLRTSSDLPDHPGVLIIDGERESLDAMFSEDVHKAWKDACIMAIKTGASCSASQQPNDRVGSNVLMSLILHVRATPSRPSKAT